MGRNDGDDDSAGVALKGREKMCAAKDNSRTTTLRIRGLILCLALGVATF